MILDTTQKGLKIISTKTVTNGQRSEKNTFLSENIKE